ncbi:lipase family protein [Conexibacter sp. JD483]|uniref:lipase family protein n=1 Tax=unclassified Conexibacter TaxID=2627773 RepID=UPI0027273A22|nr:MULTISPECIES: lipase family protein [unclassified Conexibacter]MDO8184948.1 lipase family protein [Conexibacter sp. CPCC 205706]MDO8198092.1 lipase family protein [Conexibacter sp. CPCC 205762]MDR9368286.1 lipase family protein [Conexibacter sp. JD483]
MPNSIRCRSLSPVRALLALVTLLAALACAATPALALDPPSGNAFYTPPSPLPAGRAGDVIWYRVANTSIARDNNANAYEVLYRSTNVAGNAIAVSGTVLVPRAAWTGRGTRPLTAYASGTQGWDDSCAPSREMTAGNFDESFAVSNLLARGWAVAVTDYPGLGTPGDHQYNVGISEGRAVLDILRAATRLSPAGISATTQVGVEGYSQGGGAAGWVIQQEATYAPELNVVGVAGGGTPANLQAVKNNIDGSAFFAFLAGTAIGFRGGYPALDVNRYLTLYGRLAISTLNSLCQLPALALYAAHHLTEYTVGGIDPTVQPAFRAALDANNLGGIRPQVPVLQYHGSYDEVIPYSVEQNLQRQWCALGARTKLSAYPLEHVSTQLGAQIEVVNWLADRFAGVAAPSNNC